MNGLMQALGLGAPPRDRAALKPRRGTAETAARDRAHLSAAEAQLDLEALVNFGFEGRAIGAYLLARGEQQWRFVFGFRCSGIHTYQTADRFSGQLDAIEAGLKDLPPDELLTFHLRSFCQDRDRQAYLSHREASAPSVELKFLTLAERGRARELARNGLRRPKELLLFATYTIAPDGRDVQSWLERTVAKGSAIAADLWQALSGDRDDRQRQELHARFRQAYEDGFRYWEFLLTSKMGLAVAPMTADDLWLDLWQRLNDSDAIAIPHEIQVDERQLDETIRSDLHIRTLLFADRVPVAARDRLSFPDRQQHVALMTFAHKPGGWSDARSQLRYLWEVIARERAYDVEAICQIGRANEFLVTQNVQRNLRQNNLTQTLAREKSSIDVAAGIKTQRAIDAAATLYEGAVPFYCGTTFIIHRPNRRKLDAACQFLSSCFRRPAWVLREREYAWKVWFQTLPVVWDTLLAKPFERRQLYLSGELPGLLPLVTTQRGDRDGFELIASEGSAPLHLNFCQTHRNVMVLGTTRSGKSVLVSGMLTEALSQNLPIVVMDYPKPDGSSTFSDYARFLGDGAAYFDISRECSNLFELPDLSGLDRATRAERFEDYKEFLVTALMAMVLGRQAATPHLETTCRSILTLALAVFFNDRAIAQRYRAAAGADLQSEAWQQTPTLADFLPFCDRDRLEFDAIGGNLDEALQMIQLQIRYWLSSRVGQAVSRPSSFRADVPLLVFALRNLSSDDDAAILSLSAYGAALRRSLGSTASIFFIDESPILFEYDAIASSIGRLCANGAKAGIRVFISAQDPDTIARAGAAPKIFQNLNTRLIGRIQPSALPSFERILGYPRDAIAPNASESFLPNPSSLSSNWLLDDNGTLTPCQYYPSYAGLAVVANNPDEQARRQAAMAASRNKFEGLSRFKDELARTLRGDAA